MAEEITEQYDNLLAESAERSKAALKTLNIQEGYSPPMSADDHRNKAATHQAKADELLSGDKKDSNIVAARAHNKAADAIDAANKSAAKVAALD